MNKIDLIRLIKPFNLNENDLNIINNLNLTLLVRFEHESNEKQYIINVFKKEMLHKNMSNVLKKVINIYFYKLSSYKYNSLKHLSKNKKL